jgi:hypothetical protein
VLSSFDPFVCWSREATVSTARRKPNFFRTALNVFDRKQNFSADHFLFERQYQNIEQNPRVCFGRTRGWQKSQTIRSERASSENRPVYSKTMIHVRFSLGYNCGYDGSTEFEDYLTITVSKSLAWPYWN